MRLTAAFLAVVLAPILLGAGFVGYTVNAVGEERAAHQLEVAAGAVRSSVAGLCQQLRTAAQLGAAASAGQRQVVAEALVREGPVTGVRVLASDGSPITHAGRPPLPRWADCDAPAEAVGQERFRALAAAAPLTGPDDPAGGEVWALAHLDQELVERLAAAAGVAVTIRTAGITGLLTTDDTAGSAVAAASSAEPDAVTESADGRWVRRLDPTAGQPLSLVLSTSGSYPPTFYPLLSGLVVLAGLVAVLAAWRLGRSTTRPLTELAHAADRVAEGDLSVRVPVRTTDETGRLAATFNRMTHRMQLYVQALTASRDQLRRHLAVLGDTLSGTHDLERILRVILQSALTTAAGSRGAVLLVDERNHTLTGHATVPIRGAIGEGHAALPVTVPLDQGLLGRVATTGRAQRGRIDADQAPEESVALHPDEPRCRTYVVVPITAPGGVVMPTAPWPVPPGVRGVLALYDRLGGDDFDDSDLVALRTFAGQAGVAVDNVRIHQEAQRLSLTDPLTGLWNYRYLNEAIRKEVERAHRFNHPLALLVLDLDRFKEVNDAYGHPAGDAVLAEFAQRIGGVIREVDLAFRHGGEEFAVMLPETDAPGAAVLARRLGMAVRDQPMVISPRGAEGDDELPISVTVSIGIAVYPDHARTPDGLLEAADDALYAAKAAGRDTFRVAGDPESGEPSTTEPVPAGDPGAIEEEDPAAGGAQPPRQSRGR
nr:diguanylate cyclase [Natronosporangium hydrolyticum]